VESLGKFEIIRALFLIKAGFIGEGLFSKRHAFMPVNSSNFAKFGTKGPNFYNILLEIWKVSRVPHLVNP